MSQSVKRLVSSISERSKMRSETVDRSVQAYKNMNRFLAAFLEHVGLAAFHTSISAPFLTKPDFLGIEGPGLRST